MLRWYILRNLSNLERRVEALEKPMAGIDPFVSAMDSLSDNELGLLSEYRELRLAGFDDEEVQDMMGSESYELAVATMNRVEEELTAPPVRKLAASKKRRIALDGTLGGTKRQSKNPDIEDELA